MLLGSSLTIRIFFISDYQLAISAITSLLEAQADRFSLTVSARAFNLASIDDVAACSPDVVLIDIDSDADDVLPFIAKLHQSVPQTKILLLTRLDDSALQDRAVIHGARGVIDKNTRPGAIVTAITKVHEGQIWLDRSATGRLFVELSRSGKKPAADVVADRFASLTEREQRIVAFIASNSGEPGKTLAAKLCISESTLRNHLTSIYEKLGVANRNGLLAYAFQNGLTPALAK